MSGLIVYGITNCDTVKKARKWLDDHRIVYEFHDYKKQGIDAGRLLRWSTAVGWERLLNRSGTTFRKLADADKLKIDEGKALALMAKQPSMIRRPVIENGAELIVGFDPDRYRALIS